MRFYAITQLCPQVFARRIQENKLCLFRLGLENDFLNH